jgi:hypothetical protein
VKEEVAVAMSGMSIAEVGAVDVYELYVVGEINVAESGLRAFEDTTLVVWIDGEERGGEADAERLLDRIITLQKC